MAHGNEAKIAAEAQMTLCEIKMKKFGQGSQLDLLSAEIKLEDSGMKFSKKAPSSLDWRRFTGYENMPLQHTDHFLILCRSVPVEYCSFTPDCDLLEVVFPPTCKFKGQKYSCVSINDLKKQQVSATAAINTKSDLQETLTPLYTREISCVAEVHAVTHTKIEALRYAVLALPSTLEHQTPNTSLLVVPMYTWHSISEELITAFSCADYTNSVKADAENRRKLIEEPEKVFISSKAATDELKVALQGFGVGASQDFIGGNRGSDDDMSISRDAHGILLRDLQIRSAVDEANKRYSNLQNQKGTRIDGHSKDRNKKNNFQAEKTVAEIEEEKKRAVHALIEARSHVLALNDELCKNEKNRTGHTDITALGRKRVELFDALQAAPSLKNISKLQSAERQVAKLARQNTMEPLYRNRKNAGNLPPLKQKLDLLDESLFLSSATTGV